MMVRATRDARTYVGGRLTVRTPHLAVPTRFQDGLPATPAEPSGRLDAILTRSLRLRTAALSAAELRDGIRLPAPHPNRDSPSSSRADGQVGMCAWQPATRWASAPLAGAAA